MSLASALLPVLSHALPESSGCHCQVPCSLYSHTPFLSLVVSSALLPVLSHALPESSGCHCQVPYSLYSHMPFLSLVDAIVKCPAPCTLTYPPESSGCHCQVPYSLYSHMQGRRNHGGYGGYSPPIKFSPPKHYQCTEVWSPYSL